MGNIKMDVEERGLQGQESIETSDGIVKSVTHC